MGDFFYRALQDAASASCSVVSDHAERELCAQWIRRVQSYWSWLSRDEGGALSPCSRVRGTLSPGFLLPDRSISLSGA